MKKFFVCIVLALSTLASQAQITNVKKDVSQLTTLCRFRAGLCSVCEWQGKIIMNLTSSVIIEDLSTVILADDLESARKTMYDLADLILDMRLGSTAEFSTVAGGKTYKYAVYKASKKSVNFTNLDGSFANPESVKGTVSVSRDELIKTADKLKPAE
jgi:hypothetical protein